MGSRLKIDLRTMVFYLSNLLHLYTIYFIYFSLQCNLLLVVLETEIFYVKQS
jgi:hypothetical protein